MYNNVAIAYSIYDQHSNSIWMLRGGFDNKSGGLLNISLSNGKRELYQLPGFKQEPGRVHSSESMILDHKRNSIWLNSNDGLIEFNITTKQFHPVDAMRDIAGKPDYWHFVGIDMDLKGRIWMAANPKGIMIYDPTDQSVSIPFPGDSVLQKEVSFTNNNIYCDRDGMVWSGFWSQKGIYQLIPFSPAVKLIRLHPGKAAALSFLTADSGKIWISTFSGIFEFASKSTDATLFNTQGLECLKGKEFKLPVSFDPTNRKALISTQGGVFRINLSTNKCSPVVFADSAGELIKLFDFQCSLPFRDGWFSISSYEGKQGIFMSDKNTDTVREVIRIPDIPIGAFSTGTDFYHLIFLRGDEANGNLTYTFLDNKWKRTPHPMDSLQWTCIFFNKNDKTFWVAAERSLLHYNIDFNLLKNYKRENGLPDLDIISIIADNRRQYMFHTDRSIHQLNTETGEISELTEKDGFQKQNFLPADQFNHKDENGNIYFPSLQGLN